MNNIKEETSLDDLLQELKLSIHAKDQAEKARVQAEQKKIKANYNYLSLMDNLRAKEYKI